MAKKFLKIIPISKLPEVTDPQNFAVPAIDSHTESGKIKAKTLEGNRGPAPFIGENGNWWIENQDLGIPASGDIAFSRYFTNISQFRNKYDYPDAKTAHQDVPTPMRAIGQVILFKLAFGAWKSEIFDGQSLNDWDKPEAWKNYGFTSRIFDGGVPESVYGGTRVIDCGGPDGEFDGELIDSGGPEE